MNITNHQGNVNQNHNEIQSQSGQDDSYQKQDRTTKTNKQKNPKQNNNNKKANQKPPKDNKCQ